MANQLITSLGVVVARFQVDDLHKGHLDLLNTVSKENTTMLVVLGLSPCKCTRNNPLDFDTRRRMVSQHYPNAKLAYIKDINNNAEWSKILDGIIKPLADKHTTTTLYGSRDSFIKHYSGVYNTQELIQKVYISGTDIRNQIAIRSRDTVDFRAGAIWFALSQHASIKATVDIAPLKFLSDGSTVILLGRKQHEEKYRFIGGFGMPGETYENAASRELYEETGLTTLSTNMQYERSFFIDDWRYKNEADKVTTALFSVIVFEGTPAPSDDICELQWFLLGAITVDTDIVENHREMMHYIKNKYQ